MEMCFDRRGIVLKAIGRHVGSEDRVFDAARAPEVPDVVDPERAKQVSADEAALEEWLRSRGGKPWFDGIIGECLERFPGLDRFQVSAAIYKLSDEDSASIEKADAEESVERFGADLTKLPEQELHVIHESAELIMYLDQEASNFDSSTEARTAMGIAVRSEKKAGIVWSYDDDRQTELDSLVSSGGEPMRMVRISDY